MPQLGTLLSATQVAPQASQQASVQPAARVVAHSASQVHVVTAQPSHSAASAGQAATLIHHQPSHHIRLPVSVAHSKGIAQVRSALKPPLGLSF